MINDNVIQFKTRPEIDAKENLKGFIFFCKNDLTSPIKDFDWDSNKWKGIGIFSKVKDPQKKEEVQYLDKDFINFAKAYIRYLSASTTSRWKISTSLAVLKVIEKILLVVNRDADITKINISVLDESVQSIKRIYKDSTAYDYGQELKNIIRFLGENSLLYKGKILWVNPLKRPEGTYRLSKKAEEARLSKLPNKSALNAMAEIFSLPDEKLTERDMFTSSVFALLMCAPSRISEILALPCDCEITETDSKGAEKYGLRFYSLKGYGADIKWVPDVMVPVAKKAIERLRKISKNAREFAKWIEENPSKFFRRDSLLDVGEDEILLPYQISEALGYNLKRKGKNEKFLSSVDFYDSQKSYTMNSLWSIILSKLPVDFPWYDKKKGINYNNALCLLNTHQLGRSKNTIIYELHKPTKNVFLSDISGIIYDSSRFLNIFIRHGYTGVDGEPLHLKSHQVRHLLNTIAQRNGMSDLDLAKWSGRAQINQNRVYNHVSEDEMLHKAEELDISSIGSQAFMIDSVEPNLPVTSDMITLWENGAVHVTEFGYCVHDYMMSPCDKFRDCINCNEQVCIKGENEKLERLQKRQGEIEGLLAKSKLSMSEEEFGADRWVKHHESTLSRLNELIDIFSSENIPEGSRIKLGGESFTQLGRVLNKFDNLENKGNDKYIKNKKGDVYGKAP